MSSTHPNHAGRGFATLGRVVDLVLLAVIAAGLTSVVLGRVLPAIGHPVYVVAGPSMAPALAVGSAVVLDAVDPATLAVGDVVTLTSGPGRAVFTHRITRVIDRDDGRWIETRGDANAEPDPSITPVSQVIGRVGPAIPFAGYLLALLSSVPGIVLVLSSGAALMLLGWWLDDLAAARRRRAAATDRRRAVAASDAGDGAVDDEPAIEPAAPITALDLVRADTTGRRRRRRRSDYARGRS